MYCLLSTSSFCVNVVEVIEDMKMNGKQNRFECDIHDFATKSIGFVFDEL